MASDQSWKELHIDYSIRNGFADAASNVAIRKFAIGALRGSPTKVTPKAPLDWIWLSCDVRFGIERLPVRPLENTRVSASSHFRLSCPKWHKLIFFGLRAS